MTDFIVNVSCFWDATVLTQDENGDSVEDSSYVGEQPHDHSQLGTGQPNISQRNTFNIILYSFLCSFHSICHNIKSPAQCEDERLKHYRLVDVNTTRLNNAAAPM